MIRSTTIMKLRKGTWILVILAVVVAGAGLAVQLRGFRMWELPFAVFGCAILAYALFGWHAG